MQFKELTKAILKSGLTQAEIAEIVGTSQPTISRILSGAVEFPKRTTSDKLEALHAKVLKRRRRRNV